MPQPTTDGTLFYVFKKLGLGKPLHNPFTNVLQYMFRTLRGTFEGLSSDSTQENLNNGIQNWWKGTTGSGLTDAELEANQFTHDERIDAQNWTERMDNTKLQRGVADAKAAGINPMMVAGGSPSTPSSSGGQSVSPSGVGSNVIGQLAQLLLLPMQAQVMQSQANKNNAQANESEHKTAFWDMSTDKALEQINLIKEQTKTEGTKQEFYLARAVLANVNGENIKYLQESLKNYYDSLSAAAGADKTLKEAEATATLIHSLYEAKLIESGYIEELVERTQAEAFASSTAGSYNLSGITLRNKQGELTDEQTNAQHIANSLASGDFTDEYMHDKNKNWFDKFVIQGKRLMEVIIQPVEAIGSFF